MEQLLAITVWQQPCLRFVAGVNYNYKDGSACPYS